MPGLLRGVARTAAIAGTATAVSNRVSRRQGNRWAEKEQATYDQQAPPPQYAQQQYAPAPPAPPAPVGPTEQSLDQLERLGKLHTDGILTDEEFAAQKAKILGL